MFFESMDIFSRQDVTSGESQIVSREESKTMRAGALFSLCKPSCLLLAESPIQGASNSLKQ